MKEQTQESRTARTRIRLGTERVRRLRLSFPSDCSNADICDTLEALEFPLPTNDAYCVRYALLELTANAIRASAERKARAPVCIAVSCDIEHLYFKVSDGAGGFDPGSLPYDLYGPDDEIDLESEAFEVYRKKHNEARFGLGLVLARRAVDNFRLRLVRPDGGETDWRDDGSVHGTVVTFSKKISR